MYLSSCFPLKCACILCWLTDIFSPSLNARTVGALGTRKAASGVPWSFGMGLSPPSPEDPIRWRRTRNHWLPRIHRTHVVLTWLLGRLNREQGEHHMRCRQILGEFYGPCVSYHCTGWVPIPGKDRDIERLIKLLRSPRSNTRSIILFLENCWGWLVEGVGFFYFCQWQAEIQ